MANQVEQTTWSAKYQSKNSCPPPVTYQQLNDFIRDAVPGEEARAGQTIPRLPQEIDFPKKIETRIIPSNVRNEDVKYAIVVLHSYAADIHAEALLNFVKEHLVKPKTVCILVRGTTAFVGPDALELDGTYCWSDNRDFIGGPRGRIRALQAQRSWRNQRTRTGFSSAQSSSFAGPSRSNTATTRTEGPEDAEEHVNATSLAEDEDGEDDDRMPTFAKSTDCVGTEVIANALIKKCGFRPRDIALVGHDQGGSAALAIASACWQTVFGGVVSIGGGLPSDFPVGATIASSTHVLILGGTQGHVDGPEAARIRSAFPGTTKCLTEDEGDEFGVIDAGELSEFFAHQLRREEWTKEAVITFDGGGIRGFGSLLMLKKLIKQIALYERELDRGKESSGERLLSQSSFSPCAYPPTYTDDESASSPVDTSTLDYDQLFLPCHYFTFAGGTSTGGLISIMISRFRMTVRDCLGEYKAMGKGVFGNPRPPGLGKLVPWHKFSAKQLEAVLRDVVRQHGERVSSGDVMFPMDEDLCKTIVVARADPGRVTMPFLFRTYPCRENNDPSPNVPPPLNAGKAAQCSIVEVGRATSAAPNYFKPIEIKNWGARGYKSPTISFVDGGFGTNNPSHEILKDIKRKRNGPNETIDVFASFGTGTSRDDLKGSLSSWNRMIQEMTTEMTDVRRADEAVGNESGIHNEDGSKHFEYFRFEGGKTLGAIPMDEWSGRRKSQLRLSTRPTGGETLVAMKMAVKTFLKKETVKSDLKKLAKILVRRRRLRIRDEVAWERYACASYYECSQDGCNKRLDTAEEFRGHLSEAHLGLAPDEQLSATQQSRKCWKYRATINRDQDQRDEDDD